MGCIGFIDKNHAEWTFDQIVAGQGVFDLPGPVLRLLIRNVRGDDHYGDKDVISATTLVGSVQIAQLKRRHDYYVDPEDQLWSAYGSLLHGLLEYEAKFQTHAMAEEKLVYQMPDGTEVGGTFDLIEPLGEDEYIGSDYKFTSAYSVRGMVYEGVRVAKPEYFHQAQVYKWLLWHVKGLKARRWQLVLFCRDWQERSHGPMTAKPVPRVATLDVPLLPIADIETYVNERLVVHLAARMCDDAGLPNCTTEETWNGRRCAKYCEVSRVCHQNNPELTLMAEDAA